MKYETPLIRINISAADLILLILQECILSYLYSAHTGAAVVLGCFSRLFSSDVLPVFLHESCWTPSTFGAALLSGIPTLFVVIFNGIRIAITGC